MTKYFETTITVKCGKSEIQHSRYLSEHATFSSTLLMLKHSAELCTDMETKRLKEGKV